MNLFLKLGVLWAYFIIAFRSVIREIKDYFRPANKRRDIPSIVGGTLRQKLYMRLIYVDLRDCFKRIGKSRTSGGAVYLEGRDDKLIDMGSYDYLGFGGSIVKNPDGSSLPITYHPTDRRNAKEEYKAVLEKTEREFAKFIGSDACVFFPVGWAINATVIPILCRRNPRLPGRVLVMSDELNHNSIIIGLRLAKSMDSIWKQPQLFPKIVVFKNNSPKDLEKKITAELVQNERKDPFQKILIIAEGIYSMEGSILKLREFVEIKKRYKAYLYVDEAHSIGAIGETCKGICEFSGVNPKDVDVLMGTFTKSFASVGGYCCGSKSTIEYLEKYCLSSIDSPCMSYAPLLQISRVLSLLSNDNYARKKAENLLRISKLMRKRLTSFGVICSGDKESPVIPIIVYKITLMAEISRKCLQQGICVVVAGFPATPYDKPRVRLCMSSSHTEKQVHTVSNLIGNILKGY